MKILPQFERRYAVGSWIYVWCGNLLVGGHQVAEVVGWTPGGFARVRRWVHARGRFTRRVGLVDPQRIEGLADEAASELVKRRLAEARHAKRQRTFIPV